MAKKKKILYIVEAMGGGIFTYIVQLANGLADDFDITVAFGLRKETPKNYAEYFDQRVNMVRVKSFGRSVNPIKDLKAGREIKKIVKEVKPDIVHLHSSKAGVLGRMLISGRKHKMFYTPHGYSFLMEDVSPLKKHFYYALEKICGKKRCITVACGKSEWEKSRKVTKKSTYISNGINIETMARVLEECKLQQKPKEKKEFSVYTLGRISYQKNPELFNEIAELVPEVNFVWIGDGDLRDVLTSKNISVTGWKSSEEALKLAYSEDVFLLPSRWEGLPISLLEAMYMEKPCIVSNVVGNRDVIEHKHTGYICNEAEEFAKVIRMLKKHKDDGAIHKLCASAKNEIEKNYNGKDFCKKYKKLYLKNGKK